MCYLRHQLHVASSRWGHEQRRKVAAGGEAKRDYRILIAARGDAGRRYRDHILPLLFNWLLWSILRPSAQTEALCATAFRIVSRGAAIMWRLWGRPHLRPPFLTFMIVEQAHVADQIEDMPPCLLDPFTRSFKRVFGLRSTDAIMALLVILLLCFTDTVKSECFHAQARRILERAGVQNKALNLQDLMARVLCHRNKTREAEHKVWLPPGHSCGKPAAPAASDQGEQADAEAPEEPEQPRRGRKNVVSEWHVHCSKVLASGRRMDECSASYHARSLDQRVDDRDAAAVSRSALRNGASNAFGPTKRELAKQQKLNRAVAFNRHHTLGNGSLMDGDAPVVEAQAPIHTAGSYNERVEAINLAEKLALRERARADDALEAAAARYGAEQGHTKLLAALELVPRLSSSKSHLAVVPLQRLTDSMFTLSFLFNAAEVARRTLLSATCLPT